jgi:hypothetical protein
MEKAMSKSKEAKAEKPEFNRDYVETLVLELLEQAKSHVKLSARKNAAAQAAFLQDILNATR